MNREKLPNVWLFKPSLIAGVVLKTPHFHSTIDLEKPGDKEGFFVEYAPAVRDDISPIIRKINQDVLPDATDAARRLTLLWFSSRKIIDHIDLLQIPRFELTCFLGNMICTWIARNGVVRIVIPTDSESDWESYMQFNVDNRIGMVRTPSGFQVLKALKSLDKKE